MTEKNSVTGLEILKKQVLRFSLVTTNKTSTRGAPISQVSKDEMTYTSDSQRGIRPTVGQYDF